MNFDLSKILANKQNYRRDLAARPIAEKLRMLDALRERAITLRNTTEIAKVDKDALREQAPTYKAKST